MRTRVSALLLVALSFSFPHPIGGQTPSQKPQEDPAIRLRATEVSLDIVVRDKKGKPVKDLTAADFEIYEDGVRQRIESFRLVSRDEAPAAGTTKPKEGVAPALPGTAPARDSGMPGLIALVFDRLAPQARSLARNAGMAYAQEGMVTGDFTGVFSIDQALRTIQPFTDKPELIKQAVDQATSAATSTYASNAGRVRDLSDRSLSLDRTISSQGGAAAAAGASRDGGGQRRPAPPSGRPRSSRRSPRWRPASTRTSRCSSATSRASPRSTAFSPSSAPCGICPGESR